MAEDITSLEEFQPPKELTPEQYLALIQQILVEARPMFTQNAKRFGEHNYGVEYEIVAPAIYEEEPNLLGSPDVARTARTSGKFSRALLGHLLVSKLQTPNKTEIRYRSDSGGTDFDIDVNPDEIKVVGAEPAQVYFGLKELLSGRADEHDFQPQDEKISVYSYGRLEWNDIPVRSPVSFKLQAPKTPQLPESPLDPKI